MTVRATWLTNRGDAAGGQTREDTRRAPTGTMTPADETTTHSGVIPGGDPYLLDSTGSMTFTIGTGRSVIQGTAVQGAYGHTVTDPETFTVGDGDASLARIDAVYAVIYDHLYDASGSTAADVVLVAGAPATSPDVPAPPTPSSLLLWTIGVPAGTSAGSGGINWGTDVVDWRTYTVAVGGIGLGQVDGAYPGQWRDSGGATGTLSRYNGTTWESTLRLGAGGSVELGSAVLSRSSGGAVSANTHYQSNRAAAGDSAFAAIVSGNTYDLYRVYADGKIEWGPGTAARDTNLYRRSANVLATDDAFDSATVETTTGVTTATGWAVTDQHLWVTSGVSTVSVTLNRTGAALGTAEGFPSTSGNISPDYVVCTVPAAWRPPVSLYILCSTGIGHGSLRVNPSGVCEILTWIPNQTISSDSNVRFTYTFSS